MKNLLLSLFLVFSITSVFSQEKSIKVETSHVSLKMGDGIWGEPLPTKVLISFYKDGISIDSKVPQLYIVKESYDPNISDNITSYTFICNDKNGVKCMVTLMVSMEAGVGSAVVVEYSDVAWMYIIQK